MNPASRRVMRGNMYSTIANASQASAKILHDQANKDKRSLYDFTRDEGLQFLGHFLAAHQAGTSAMVENPEWEQIGMATMSCRKDIEIFLRKANSHWALICSRYKGNSTLEMLMRQIDPERHAIASSGMEAIARAASNTPLYEAGRLAYMIKVLLLSANPIDSALRIDEEFRAIDTKIRGSAHRDHVQLINHGAVRLEDIPGLLMRHKPHVVHFSGHGNVDGIELTTADGSSKMVPPNALANIFKALKDNVRVVLLNACDSEPQAQAIVSVIDCAVGMADEIDDDAAVAFAAAFYEALGYGRSVETAFELALVQLTGAGENPSLAKLHKRRGVKPSEIVLVNPANPL